MYVHLYYKTIKMDLNQKSSADHIIEHLLAIDVDGETMEYIINGVCMDEQVFRQLFLKASLSQINQLMDVKKFAG